MSTVVIYIIVTTYIQVWGMCKEKSMKNKIMSLLLIVVLIISMLTGCSKSKETEAANIETGEAVELPGVGKVVALAMPTQYSDRWISDCSNMKEQLEALGYIVHEQFAEDDIELQISQIEGFIEQKVDCLVIAPIDASALTEVEASAKEAGIPIIAYDRLLMDTDAVSYYATFDNKGVGIAIGETIVAQAKLEEVRAAGDYRTIEFFMGSPDDNNAIMLYKGMMEILQPYLDDGTLVCNSGKISFEDTCILRWSQHTAEKNCKQYLAMYYMEEDLDICASAFDKFSYACIDALKANGYTEENWPVISGGDAELEACKNIMDGTQTFSIYKDTRLLAEKCVTMVNAVCNGTEPAINDTQQYNNNVITVPSYLCTPVVVNKDNLKSLIIDGGYYTEEQLYE